MKFKKKEYIPEYIPDHTTISNGQVSDNTPQRELIEAFHTGTQG